MIGGLVMAVMSNGMQLMGVQTSIQQIVKGLVLLLVLQLGDDALGQQGFELRQQLA